MELIFFPEVLKAFRVTAHVPFNFPVENIPIRDHHHWIDVSWYVIGTAAVPRGIAEMAVLINSVRFALGKLHVNTKHLRTDN